MEVIKAAVMGIAAAMLALYMKSVRPEYSSNDQHRSRYFYFWICTDLSSENYREY